MSGEIDFLYVNKNESLIQIDIMNLIGIVKQSQSSQNSMVTMSLQYIKKEIRREIVFSLQMNIKIYYMLISTLWASKLPTRRYYHYCWVWSSIVKVLKVISLYYLYNISKKEVRKGVHFLHADEHQSFYKLGLFLMEVARHVQSTQNRNLLSHVSSQSQTRNFLPEYLNIKIKQQLCGKGFPSLLPLLQADVFQ